MIPLEVLVRPTGFEPAFLPAGSVRAGRSPQETSSLQSGRYQAVKEETQFPCGFQVHLTKLVPICKKTWKPLARLGSHGFSGFGKIVVKQ